MTNDGMTNDEWKTVSGQWPLPAFGIRHSALIRHSSFVIRHLSFSSGSCALALATALAILCSSCGHEGSSGRKVTDGPFTNSFGMELVPIPAGEFVMGSTEADIRAILANDPRARGEFVADEKPAHKVRFARAFLMGKHEVTVGQFRKFVQATNYKTYAEERDGANVVTLTPQGVTSTRIENANWRNPYFKQTDADPVACVCWHDAKKFTEWLNAKDTRKPAGWEYRLPTEAEWEYAARGPKSLVYPWGNEWDGTRANFAAKGTGLPWDDKTVDDGYPRTAPVGSFSPQGDSPFGVSGMADNVGEWCEDYYAAYSPDDQTNPVGPTFGNFNVVRGGSWCNDPRNLRAAVRGSARPWQRSDNIGFRVVLVPEPPQRRAAR